MIVNRKVLLFIALLAAIIVGGYLLLKNSQPKYETRTDRKVIDERFLDFPKTEELYWTSYRIGTRTPGPTSLRICIWAVLPEKDFSRFIQDTEYESIDSLDVDYQPEEIKGTFHWKKIKEDNVRTTNKLQSTTYYPDIYFEKSRHLICVEYTGDK